MKFVMTFSWTPDPQRRAEGIARFNRTGGLPPDGVKLLGRWTQADLGGGFDLLETDDPAKLAEFSYMWSDLMELKITPVLEDKELSAVLQRAARQA